jgi:hypothetical protein
MCQYKQTVVDYNHALTALTKSDPPHMDVGGDMAAPDSANKGIEPVIID